MRQKGGESQSGTAILVRGYSEKAQCTGKNARSYLDANRDSLQKPIGTCLFNLHKPIGEIYYLIARFRGVNSKEWSA